ncbi:MAG TPA: trypsin-like peptidase domain-containing protein [Gemmatimonadaceae bacterium]|nr:trypsin-like peptidase domain-containing protein [Gemmatimonadaceae bacterium]
MRGAVLLALVAAAVACRGDAPRTASTSAATLPPAALPSLHVESANAAIRSDSIDSRRRTILTDAVAKVSPTVVTVQTEVVQNAPADPFDAFFGGAGSSQRVLQGLGTGFIVRSDGVIVTNAHVVNDAKTISVALRDGTSYHARLVGKDETNDIAVLKIDAKNLPVAELGNSDSLLIGEWAIAIGNPYGFLLGNSEPSVTTGVISGTGRNLVAPNEGSATYVDMIQTDAAINHGNSGGPLVDAVGEVIGMNSSIYSPSGGSVGLGFAIPINRVKRVMEDLLLHGVVRQPWLGIKLELPQTNSPLEALRFGVNVRAVVPGSPADGAGLKAGDILLRAGSRVLRNPFDWEAEKLDLRVGERVQLTVKRGDRQFPVTVTVSSLPDESAPKIQVLKELELVTVTPAIRAERGIRSAHGALIYAVSSRVSDDLGIAKGDVIVQINQVPIDNAQDVQKALNALAGRTVIHMYFERGGQIYTTDFMVR